MAFSVKTHKFPLGNYMGVINEVTGDASTQYWQTGLSRVIFYIGQTASLGETVTKHRKDPWLEQFHGNCVCIHLEKDEGQRKKKIADLSRRYHPKMKTGYKWEDLI